MAGRKVKLVLAMAIAGMVLTALVTPASAARIKDLAQIDGVRENQLMGFGLVGGLAGTGDDPKNAPYTAEAIANMMATFGFQMDPLQIKVKNFAGVMVTANLPAYTSNGDKLDVTVSAVGTSKSLNGGMLYQTILRGADNEVYAVAQGPVSLGTTIGGGTGGQSEGHPTVGRIPGGAFVENAVPSTILKSDGGIHLNLNHPDFTTANAMTEAINLALGEEMARAEDAGMVSVRVPLAAMSDLVPFIAIIENLDVDPGTRAMVVINQRTGTIVIGHEVVILPVAVTHGSMTLTFGEIIDTPGLDEAAQPPLPGQPAVAVAELERGTLRGPTTAEHVATGLNKMSLGPADIVAIFEAIDAAGALLGRLEIL